MKKIFSIVALAAISVGAGAQNLYEENLFRDNWSIGLDGGISTNLHRWDNGGGVLGLHISKGITPVVSFEFSTQLGFDDMGWDGDAKSWSLVGNDNHVSSLNVMGTTKINLMNWWGGYNGRPRLFEIQARGGVGYLRYTDVKPHNSAVGKVGLDFDFNLGEKRAWTVSLRPAILWDVTKYGNFEGGKYAQMQLTAGVTYHFKNHTGEHYITTARPIDQTEVEALTARINAMRREIADKEGRLQYLQGELGKKPKEVVKVETRTVDGAPRVETRTMTLTERSRTQQVTFKKAKTDVERSQMPNVEFVANYLKKHKDAHVVLEGFASPEGNAAINEELARDRAEEVKKILIKKYKISPSRITARGMGVSDSFSEPDWNRVCILTVMEE